MFRRILQKRDRPEGNSSAGGEVETNGGNEGPSEKEDVEGFVCPICMVKFGGMGALQLHFESAHGDGADSPEMRPENIEGHSGERQQSADLLAIRSELDDVTKSLEEERWYSSELRSELQSAQAELQVLRHRSASMTDSTRSKEKEEEHFLVQQQLQASEESRLLLNSQVNSLTSENERLLKEKLSLDEKHDLAEGKIASMNEEIERLNRHLVDLEVEQSTLKSELRAASLRAEKDAVESDAAKQIELVSLRQRLALREEQLEVAKTDIDEARRRLSKEAERTQQATDQTSRAAEESRAQVESLEARMVQLTAEKDAAMRDAAAVAEELGVEKDKRQELEGMVDQLRSRILTVEEGEASAKFRADELQSRVEQETTKLTTASNSVAELQTELSRAGELRVELEAALKNSRDTARDVERQMSEHERAASAKSFQMEKLNQQLAEALSQVEELRVEKEEMLSKIDHEDAAKTLIEQMTKERSLLEAKLIEAHANLAKSEENHLKEKEFLESSLTDQRLEVQRLEEAVTRTEASLKDEHEKVEQRDGRVQRAEEEVNQLRKDLAGERTQCQALERQLESLKRATEAEISEHKSSIARLSMEMDSKTTSLQLQISEHKETISRGREEKSEMERQHKLKVSSKNKEMEEEQRRRREIADELEQMKREAAEANQMVSTVRSDLLAVTMEKTDLQERKDEVEGKLRVMEQNLSDMTEHCRKAESELSDYAEKMVKLEEEKSNLNRSIADARQFAEDVKQELDTEKELYADKCRVEELLTKKINELHEKSLELTEKVTELEDEVQSTKISLLEFKNSAQSKEELVLEGKEREKMLTQTIASKEVEISDYERRLVTSQDERQTLQASLAKLELDFEGERSLATKHRENINQELELTKSKLLSSHSEVANLEIRLEDMRSEARQVEEQRASLASQLENANSELQTSREQRILLEEEAARRQVAAKLVADNLHSQIAELDVAKEDAEQSVVALREQKKLLVDEIAVMKEQQQRVEEDAREMQEMLREDNIQLQHRLDKETSSLNETSQRLAAVSTECQTLSDQIQTFRGEFQSAEQQNLRLESALNEAKASAVDMEIRLENIGEEKKLLMERVLTAEEESRSLMDRISTQRNEIDQLHAALHELGLENQSLQVEREKKSTLKWVSDQTVTQCPKCNREFNLTLRKHHCRNCGGIYCGDCSAKSAATAASKKPVRVCDSCYLEISRNTRPFIHDSNSSSLT